MKLVDIGANLTHRSFAADLAEVIDRAERAGMCAMIATGTSERGSREAAALARARPGAIYATAGVHPHDAKSCDANTLERLREIARSPGVVAIGECGLDYDRDFSPRETQRKWFEAQLELAIGLGLPVFLHERSAHADFVEILSRHRARLRDAVVHCFTGTERELAAYLALDCHIGITGWICDERRGAGLVPLIPKIPPERLMIETDAPFLLPRNIRPKPSKGRNEPAFLTHVLEAVARAADRSPETIAAETTENATRFFGLAPC
jgi:TatD DNase family protein